MAMFLLAVCLMPFTHMWSGYVLTILWEWFIVPTFGLPALQIAPAIGIAIVSSYLTHQYIQDFKKEGSQDAQFAHAISFSLARPALALLVGWIVKQWM